MPLRLAHLRGGAVEQAALGTGLLESSASLTKNIMGIGVLTLAAGMSAGTGVGPATMAMAAATLAASYLFALIGDSCEMSGLQSACTFDSLWANAFGEGSTWLASTAIGSLTFCICAVYLICLGELLPPLLTLMRAPKAMRGRRAAVIIAALAVFPLCLARSLAGLSFTSYLGVSAVGYTALFSMVRCVDGSYGPGGRFYARMPVNLRASFDGLRPWKISGETAVLIANLGVALCVHFNAPSFYRSLTGATSKRFSMMTHGAFALVFVLSLFISHPGYFTFGSHCQPLILNNYHPSEDHLATAARVATAASLCCSFPLVFAALRESCLPPITFAVRCLLPSSLSRAEVVSPAAWWAATLLLPSSALALALAADDLGLVVGLLGSILGGFLMYVAPTAIHARLLLRAGKKGLSLWTDALLLLYGLFGQMICGTLITYRHAAARKL